VRWPPMVAEKPAHFGDGLRSAFEELRAVVHRIPGTQGAAGLLVSEEGEDDVPLGLFPGPGEAPQDRKDHGVHVLHVDGAAAPDEPVLQFGAERVHGPLVLEGGNHVEVAVHYQGAGRRVLTGHPGDHVRAAGRRLKDLRFHADFFNEPGCILGRCPLPRS
jgi:hypothetical protein